MLVVWGLGYDEMSRESVKELPRLHTLALQSEPCWRRLPAAPLAGPPRCPHLACAHSVIPLHETVHAMAAEAQLRPPPAHQLGDTTGEADHAFQEAAVTQEEIERFTVRPRVLRWEPRGTCWGGVDLHCRRQTFGCDTGGWSPVQTPPCRRWPRA